MINRADIPELVFPNRRIKELDGIALGKELTGLIRGAKTRGAVNKALAQHGTLASPEAIETVRQNMGTWFSAPEEIIKLQDTLYNRQKDARDYDLEGRKITVQQEIAEANIEADKEAAALEADTRIMERDQDYKRAVVAEGRRLRERRQDRLEEIEARKTIANTLKANQDKVAARLATTKGQEDARKRLKIQTDSIDEQIDNIYTRATANLEQGLTPEDRSRITALMQRREELSDRAIRTTFETDEEFQTFINERNKTRDVGLDPDVLKAERELQAQQFQEKTRKELSELPIEDLISRLPASMFDWDELSDKLDDEVTKVAKLEQRIAQKERLNFQTLSAKENLKLERESLEKSKEKLNRLRTEAEKTLLKQELKTFKTTTGDGAQSGFSPAKGPGLSATGGGDLVDQFTQMALNSPQGQEMMRRLMEEQQIG